MEAGGLSFTRPHTANFQGPGVAGKDTSERKPSAGGISNRKMSEMFS